MRTSPAELTHAATAIELSAGQRYYLWSERDASLLLQAGTIRLHEAPHWIAEALLGIQVDLQDGQYYLLQRRGWTCIQAIQDSQLTYQARAPRAYAPLGWLMQQAKAMRQHLKHKTQQLLALR